MKYQKHLDKIERTGAAHIPEDKIRLNSAERNIPLDDFLWQKYIKNLKETDIRYYPDQQRAIDLIARHEGVQSSQITVGHGSDQVIKNIFECFAIPASNIVTTNPCFPMYNVYADIFNVECRSILYSNEKVDLASLLAAIDHNTSIVIISNPSSPVGDTLSVDDINIIISKASDMNAIVVLDEAYIEFSECNSFADISWAYPNLIVTKTFSKAVGAAGIRFGYAISNSKIAAVLSKVKNMYEITGPTLKWVETVLDNWTVVTEYVTKVKHNRTILLELLKKHYDVVSGECNWIHTTKTNFPDNIVTRQCTLPWSNKTWTRLCVPGDYQLMLDIAGP